MRPYLLEIREIIYFILAEVPGVCMANSFWKAFLLNQPPHTPYSAEAVPGINTFFTFWTIYFKIQTGVTWHCPGHHIEVIKCIMRGKVAR